ncbi:hypothetical protein GBA65_15670 [Rubrobacter marinus]|uniref:Uncharacterized protein n=1 Tax=Rubrobacter marinus TaxID=2653852 RepID=A0A6G8PZT2_9ACTN|nr:hypothetical protein [Rubrobacter marinus]QIN79733.1 hypothetical protein GBA65_15670 [Rubrobacter marinus]
MAEEEKPKQLVQPSTVIASGITAIVAALFTSRLGVAGTLIGTALTPMLMTIGVAVLNAQIEKATSRISELPTTVKGRLSTQRVRVPGTPSPEDHPPEEPDPPAPARRRDRRAPGVVERLLSIPTHLREMSPSARRRTLLTGVAAGLVAAVIGLAGVTGIEAASGGPLSCTLYEECSQSSASGEETGQSGTSFSRFLGGSEGAETQDAPTGGEQLPADEQQPAPDAQQTSQDQQYQGAPQGGNGQNEGAPESAPVEPAPQEEGQPAGQEDPGAVPQDAPQQPSASPDAEQQPVTPTEEQQ